jgi:hypothetical protein
MKIMAIVDSVIESPLFEMAFQRKAIIDRLRGFQFQINAHALKIIAWPDAQEVPHWKHELTTWGNDLAASWLRGRPSRPMGFDLAWKHLYLEPFEGAEDQALQIRLQHVEAECRRPIAAQPAQIMAEYMAFIRRFCEAIGLGQLTGDIVNALGESTSTPLPETAKV